MYFAFQVQSFVYDSDPLLATQGVGKSVSEKIIAESPQQAIDFYQRQYPNVKRDDVVVFHGEEMVIRYGVVVSKNFQA